MQPSAMAPIASTAASLSFQDASSVLERFCFRVKRERDRQRKRDLVYLGSKRNERGFSLLVLENCK